jgi:hypothetical protein
MISLHFEGDSGPKYFEFVYEGFMVGGSLEKTKGLTSLRREINILDKLELISEVFECGKMLPINEPCRKLKSEKEEIIFEKAEIELILRYFSLVPWSTGRSARTAIEVYDWLESTIRDSGK